MFLRKLTPVDEGILGNQPILRKLADIILIFIINSMGNFYNHASRYYSPETTSYKYYCTSKRNLDQNRFNNNVCYAPSAQDLPIELGNA